MQHFAVEYIRACVCEQQEVDLNPSVLTRSHTLSDASRFLPLFKKNLCDALILVSSHIADLLTALIM